MTAALDVADLSVRGPHGLLVRGVSFSLAPGQALTLLGESGAGKSLLARALLGNLPAGLHASGELRLNGSASRADRPETRRGWWGHQIALLPQEPWAALDPTMRVLPQVAEVSRFVRGLAAAAAHDAAIQSMNALGLGEAIAKYPFQMSGGMAQRAAFAAVRSGGAPLLIVDEPTKGLDTDWRNRMLAQLQAVLVAGDSVLTITHDVAVARALGGQVMVMCGGEVVEQGSADELLAAPRHDYTRRLLAAEPSAWPVRPAAPKGAPVLIARGLAKAFGAQRLFERLDLDVHAGERLAIVGPSGSGKSTLGNLLLSLLAPDAGTVRRADGLPATALQKLYQDPGAAFAPRVSLRDSIDDLCKRHRLDGSRVAPLLVRLGLDASLLERLPQQVSGGELQRLALMRALLLDPVLVFADEPTSRLDTITQRDTLALLLDVLEERGGALLLVTHDVHIAARVAPSRLDLVAVGR